MIDVMNVITILLSLTITAVFFSSSIIQARRRIFGQSFVSLWLAIFVARWLITRVGTDNAARGIYDPQNAWVVTVFGHPAAVMGTVAGILASIIFAIAVQDRDMQRICRSCSLSEAECGWKRGFIAGRKSRKRWQRRHQEAAHG